MADQRQTDAVQVYVEHSRTGQRQVGQEFVYVEHSRTGLRILDSTFLYVEWIAGPPTEERVHGPALQCIG